MLLSEQGHQEKKKKVSTEVSKKKIDNPFSHWTDSDWEDLWGTLFLAQQSGNNSNFNRGTIVKHWCQLSEEARMRNCGIIQADLSAPSGGEQGAETPKPRGTEQCAMRSADGDTPE